MSGPPHLLDATKQAHVDAVTAAAAGGSDSDSAAALAELRRLLPQLKLVPSSALTFGDRGRRLNPSPADLLGELTGTQSC